MSPLRFVVSCHIYREGITAEIEFVQSELELPEANLGFHLLDVIRLTVL